MMVTNRKNSYKYRNRIVLLSVKKNVLIAFFCKNVTLQGTNAGILKAYDIA